MYPKIDHSMSFSMENLILELLLITFFFELEFFEFEVSKCYFVQHVDTSNSKNSLRFFNE